MTAQYILNILEQSQHAVSGEVLGKKLGISRASVWKHIKTLQKLGFCIDCKEKLGYTLHKTSDVLFEPQLNEKASSSLQFEVHEQIDSTNTYLQRIAEQKPHGYVVVASEQTQGRGRLNRTFFSPQGTGIYMSILLKPNISVEEAGQITARTALAVCQSIEEVLLIKPKIKWVNDIFVQGKKVCGILTQASFNAETSQIDHIIVGIGLNVYQPKGDFPPELLNIAGYLCEQERYGLKHSLILNIANKVMQFNSPSPKTFYEDYKKRCFILGQPITVHDGVASYDALAKDLDERCRLLVRLNNGEEKYLYSGEVSIKL